MPDAVSTNGNQKERSHGVGHSLSHRSLNLLVKLTVLCGLLFVSSLGMEFVSSSYYVWAESAPSQPTGQLKGNILRGRELFNGKGVCYYCHGIDGYIDRPPRLAADTAALIGKLNPLPTDLRNPEILRLKTNKERARAIREGHPGTGMFPDTTMTDQDLADTLLYLALIRKDPHPEQ
jgi:mono/diheme cytochrome c family protein